MNNVAMDIQELRNKAWDVVLEALKGRNPEFPETLIKAILLTYLDNKGVNAVVDIYAFIRWCRDQEQQDGYIWSQIMHDINGREDEWMTPRTSGYGKEYFSNVVGLI